MAQEYRIRPREAALEAITAYITAGKLRPGDRLPAEREMCQMWSLNRSTLRSALSRLERDGTLDIRQGAGIFVARPKFRRNLQNLKSFSQESCYQGLRLENRVLSLSQIECDKQFSRRFQVMLGTLLWRLSRLRIIDGGPVAIETSFFRQDRFPKIDRFDFGKDSLFRVFEMEYGAKPVFGDEKVSITKLTTEEADLLDASDGSPAFWIVSQTRDGQGDLLEYCRTVARADRLVLTSVLKRSAPEEPAEIETGI